VILMGDGCAEQRHDPVAHSGLPQRAD
jgi:hypothetical protein